MIVGPIRTPGFRGVALAAVRPSVYPPGSQQIPNMSLRDTSQERSGVYHRIYGPDTWVDP